MIEDILTKLGSAVNVKDFSEKDIVYIFVEIRKLGEQSDVGNSPFMFFMCDWVVHCKMDRKKTVALLGMLESNINLDDGFMRNVTGFVSFLDLKIELLAFLKKYEINPKNLEDNWGGFLSSLVAVISDCPLENTKGKIIKSFVIKALKDAKYGYEVNVAKGSISHPNNKKVNITSIKGYII